MIKRKFKIKVGLILAGYFYDKVWRLVDGCKTNMNNIAIPYKFNTKYYWLIRDDIFIEKIPLNLYERIYEIMKTTPDKKYIFVTKHFNKLFSIFSNTYLRFYELDNIIVGIKVSSQKELFYNRSLLNYCQIPTVLIIEPIECINLSGFESLDWIITDFTNDIEWLRYVIKFCKTNNIRLFIRPFYISGRKKMELPVINGQKYAEIL